jgi:ATP adenylyltransferase
MMKSEVKQHSDDNAASSLASRFFLTSSFEIPCSIFDIPFRRVPIPRDVPVTHERIWAPWRMQYIDAGKDAPRAAEAGCFLCRYRDESDDAGNLVLLRGEAALVVMNRFPYNNGHLLVAPLAHKGALGDLDDGELLECMQLLQRLTALFEKLLTPDGFNIGLNLGRAAGAGLPGHLHWHLVPRWVGDTNFMPVLADVDVIPQSLEALYALLRPELADLAE